MRIGKVVTYGEKLKKTISDGDFESKQAHNSRDFCAKINQKILEKNRKFGTNLNIFPLIFSFLF